MLAVRAEAIKRGGVRGSATGARELGLRGREELARGARDALRVDLVLGAAPVPRLELELDDALDATFDLGGRDALVHARAPSVPTLTEVGTFRSVSRTTSSTLFPADEAPAARRAVGRSSTSRPPCRRRRRSHVDATSASTWLENRIAR